MSLIPGIAPLSSVLAYRTGSSQNRLKSSLIQALTQGEEKNGSSNQIMRKLVETEQEKGFFKPKTNGLNLLA